MRPISVLKLWISEGLTQASLNFKGRNYRVNREFPELLSQQILPGIILVGRLCVHSSREDDPLEDELSDKQIIRGLRAAHVVIVVVVVVAAVVVVVVVVVIAVVVVVVVVVPSSSSSSSSSRSNSSSSSSSSGT